jgi:hypothetical protein
MDVWEDELCMIMFNGRQLLLDVEKEEKSKVEKCIFQYYWSHDCLMFKGLVVPRLNTTIKCGCNSLIPIKLPMNSMLLHCSPFTTTNEFTQNLVKSLGVHGHLLL